VLLLAAFSSYYMAVMAGATALVWTAGEWRGAGARRRRFVLAALAATAVPALLLAALSGPYFARAAASTAAGGGLYTTDLSLLWEYRDVPGAAEVRDFALAGRPFELEMLHDPGFRGRVTLGIIRTFVIGWFGLVPLCLAALGLFALRARAAPARATAARGLVFTVLAGVLMLGPLQAMLGGPTAIPGLAFLGAPVRFFRVPFRFAVLAGFGHALLAAAALEALARRRGPRVGAVAAGLAALAVALTHGRALGGRGLDVVAGPSFAVHRAAGRVARSDGGGPLLELPLFDRAEHGLEREAMAASTQHWLPLVSGLTGYPAAHRGVLLGAIGRLPDPQALQDLVDMRRLGAGARRPRARPAAVLRGDRRRRRSPARVRRSRVAPRHDPAQAARAGRGRPGVRPRAGPSPGAPSRR
jgi:hypothetical protein